MGVEEQIAELGDDELIEALESGDFDFEGDETGAEQESKAGVETQKENSQLQAEKETDVKTESSTTEAAEAGTEKEGKILSQDGKHTIPYEVLKNSRAKNKQYGEELSVAQQENAAALEQLKELRAANERMTKQLEENEIAPAKTPDELLKNVDFDELKGEYGEVGELIQALSVQNKQLMDQMASSPTEPNGEVDEAAMVDRAISANTDISGWQSGDADRWEFAVSVDQKLREDPAFTGKSLDERFAEVAKRTKAAFGDDTGTSSQAAESAAQAARAATNQAPRTLSEIGGTGAAQEKTLDEKISDMGEDELADYVAGLSAAQLDAYLNS